MSTSPVVAVIHATTASVTPVQAAFSETCPDVDLWHLLDDRLVKDADAAGGLTDELRHRMSTLIGYAIEGGADAVQLACSMYGPVASEQTAAVPVLPSDEAMFDEVARLHPRRVGVLASLEAAASDTIDRLTAHLQAGGVNAEVEGLVVPTGDGSRRQETLQEAARELAPRVDVLALAQYSLAPLRAAVAEAVEVPVLSPPHLAAQRVVTLLPDTGESS
jgi:Asp/Glu/hydantoin racemase